MAYVTTRDHAAGSFIMHSIKCITSPQELSAAELQYWYIVEMVAGMHSDVEICPDSILLMLVTSASSIKESHGQPRAQIENVFSC